MRQSVLDLRAFYASPLGEAARAMVSRKIIEVWGDCAGLDVLALGYATPFLYAMEPSARSVVAAMPAAQGVEAWPFGGPNRVCLVDEGALPFGNSMLERVIAIHALEESADPAAVLDEICRVTAPSGRIILAVAARRGLWAGSETSPFGHGRPFSRAQLERLVREADLTPVGWTRALYAPPMPWAARWAESFEHAGARLWSPFAGIVLMEAVKQTWATTQTPIAKRVRARARARPVFAPAPVGGRSVLD